MRIFTVDWVLLKPVRESLKICRDIWWWWAEPCIDRSILVAVQNYAICKTNFGQWKVFYSLKWFKFFIPNVWTSYFSFEYRRHKPIKLRIFHFNPTANYERAMWKPATTANRYWSPAKTYFQLQLFHFAFASTHNSYLCSNFQYISLTTPPPSPAFRS